MPIHLKSDFDLTQMRISGDLTRQVLDMIGPHIQPGVTTLELDQICHSFIVDTLNAIPAPLNYRGFPKSICTSVNHVICHGIPGPKTLRDGDILNIDITVILDSWYGDTSRMFYVGEPSIKAKRLTECFAHGLG